MKKIFGAVLLTLLCVFTSEAQIEKGAILVSGASNFGWTNYSSSLGGSSISQVFVSLKGGYFVADNLAIGLDFGYQSVSSVSSSTIGVFGRYYPSGKAFLGAGYSSVSASGSGTGSSSSGIFSAEAGYAAFVGKVVAFEPALRFQSYSGGSNFGINLGISVYFNRGE